MAAVGSLIATASPSQASTVFVPEAVAPGRGPSKIGCFIRSAGLFPSKTIAGLSSPVPFPGHLGDSLEIKIAPGVAEQDNLEDVIPLGLPVRVVINGLARSREETSRRIVLVQNQLRIGVTGH